MTLITTRDSAHDFIVNFSPSMCVAVVASLIGEIAASSLPQVTMLMHCKKILVTLTIFWLCTSVAFLLCM